MPDNDLAKKAEAKIREWLDRPEEGYCFDRIPDQMTGHFGSKNICDFTLFKSPFKYYLESKATWEDRFDFSMITDYQYEKMLEKSKIDMVFSYIVVLFASYQRAFLIDIRDIEYMIEKLNQKSLNIKKIDKWPIPYKEVVTVPNSRKKLLDYRHEDNVL